MGIGDCLCSLQEVQMRVGTVLGLRHHSGAFVLLLAAAVGVLGPTSIGCVRRHHATPVPHSAASRGMRGNVVLSAKAVTPEEAARRCGFDLTVPRYLPVGLSLQTAQIAWIERDPAIPQVPSHYAVRLVYASTQAGKELSLIEQRAAPSPNDQNPLYRAISDGYFFTELKTGTKLCFGRRGHTDYVLISRGMPEREVARTLNHLSTLPLP